MVLSEIALEEHMVIRLLRKHLAKGGKAILANEWPCGDPERFNNILSVNTRPIMVDTGTHDKKIRVTVLSYELELEHGGDVVDYEYWDDDLENVEIHFLPDDPNVMVLVDTKLGT